MLLVPIPFKYFKQVTPASPMSGLLKMVFPYLSPVMTMTQYGGAGDDGRIGNGGQSMALLLYECNHFGILQVTH